MGHTGATTSWAKIATSGTQGRRQDRDEVEEEEQMVVHTECIEREPERERVKYKDDERASQQGKQGLQKILEQEGTDRSDTMEATKAQTMVPTQREEAQMECEGERQEKQTEEARQVSLITQQYQHEDNQSEVEAKGSGEEAVEADLWSTVDTSAPTEVGDMTAVQPTRPKRPKKLKVERRGSPPSVRRRSRVRSVLKHV